MTATVRLVFKNMTATDYEKAHELVTANGTPEGLLLHTAGPIEGGWQVIDTWESIEAFKTFQTTVLAPKLAAAGVTVMPEVVTSELLNVWAPGAKTLGTIGADTRVVAHA